MTVLQNAFRLQFSWPAYSVKSENIIYSEMCRGNTKEDGSREDVDRLVRKQDKLKKWKISSNK